jgi:hypothetical protein
VTNVFLDAVKPAHDKIPWVEIPFLHKFPFIKGSYKPVNKGILLTHTILTSIAGFLKYNSEICFKL